LFCRFCSVAFREPRWVIFSGRCEAEMHSCGYMHGSVIPPVLTETRVLLLNFAPRKKAVTVILVPDVSEESMFTISGIVVETSGTMVSHGCVGQDEEGSL